MQATHFRSCAESAAEAVVAYESPDGGPSCLFSRRFIYIRPSARGVQVERAQSRESADVEESIVAAAANRPFRRATLEEEEAEPSMARQAPTTVADISLIITLTLIGIRPKISLIYTASTAPLAKCAASDMAIICLKPSIFDEAKISIAFIIVACANGNALGCQRYIAI